jgi:protein SCO1/2
MIKSRIGGDTPVAKAAMALSGKAPDIRAVTTAAGYHYAYDPEHDQFAHPAAAFVVTAKGRISRVLHGLGLAGDDLRLALVEASQGRVGSFADRIHLLCYGFDPTRGVYTALIARWLAFGGVLTVVLLGGGLAYLAFTNRSGRST